MARIEEKLKAMGYQLPEPRKFPSPNRRGCVRVGHILFVSGHGPHHPGLTVKQHGKLGTSSKNTARHCTRCEPS